MRTRFFHSTLSVAILAAFAMPALADTTTQSAEADTELEEIVVTATGHKQKIKEAPASITVVTQADLQEKSYTNLAEALSDVPGVDIRNGVGKTGGLNIQMRGMPSEYTLVLIDGRRQNTSGSIAPNGFGEMANGFMPPLSQIQRIEVIRGPMSTLYGSDAMGGVVNIITKPVSSGEWGGNITADTTLHQYEGGNTRQIGFNASGPIVKDTLGIQVRGRYFDRGESERMIENGTSRDPRPGESKNYEFGTKLTYNLNENHELWADVAHSRQRYSNEDSRLGTLDFADLPSSRPGLPSSQRARGYKDFMAMEKDQFAIGHVSEFELGTWQSYVSQVKAETTGRTMPYGYTVNDNSYRFNGENRTLKNTDTTVNTKFNTELGAHNLTVGAEYQDNETIDRAAGDGVKFTQDSWAVFLEDQWKILPNLSMTMGGRYEDHSSFGGHFTPRAYLVWNTTDKITLKGGVSKGYKVPTTNELHGGINGFTGQGKTVTFGTPDLKPEESTNYEFSANYTDQRFDVTGTVFLNKVKNLITDATPIPNCNFTGGPNKPGCRPLPDFPGQESIGQLVNANKAETKGFELSSRINLTDDWYVKGAYTWLKTELDNGGEEVSYFVNAPRHAFNLHTAYNINERWKAWFEGEYKSSRERTAGNQPKAGTEAHEIWNATGNKLKGYTTFNLGTSYQVSDNLKLSAVVNNVFDRKFDDTATYTWNGEQKEAYLYSNSGRSVEGTFIERRNLWLSVSYDF